MRDLTEEWLSVLAPSHTMWTVTVLWGHVTVMNCEMRHYSAGLSGLFCLLTIITVHNNELSYLLGPLWTIETKVILWDSLSMGCRDRDEAAFNIIRWGIVSDCRVTNERNEGSMQFICAFFFGFWFLTSSLPFLCVRMLRVPPRGEHK